MPSLRFSIIVKLTLTMRKQISLVVLDRCSLLRHFYKVNALYTFTCPQNKGSVLDHMFLYLQNLSMPVFIIAGKTISINF
jgi:hypothetical protein